MTDDDPGGDPPDDHDADDDRDSGDAPLSDLADEIGAGGLDDPDEPDVDDTDEPADGEGLDSDDVEVDFGDASQETSDDDAQSSDSSGDLLDEIPDDTYSGSHADDPEESSDETVETAADETAETAADDAGADVPLSELAAEVAGDADAVDPEESPFETVETADIDPEEAWERLEIDEGFQQPDSESAAEPVEETATDAPEHVVDKRQYCQQCPYLSSPPELSCGHEGTEIVEVRDSDHFRVRSCPMIGEDGPNFDAAGDS